MGITMKETTGARGRLRAALCAAALVSCCWAPLPAGAQGRDFAPDLIVVSAADAPGELTTFRARTLLRELASQLHLQDKAMPAILLIHARSRLPGVGSEDQQGETFVVHQRAEGRRLYQLWVLGEPDDLKLVQVFSGALQHCFDLRLSGERWREVARATLLRAGTTVDVRRLRRQRR